MQYIPLMQNVSIKCQNLTTAVRQRIGSGGFQCQELEVICQIPLYFLVAFSYLLAKKRHFWPFSQMNIDPFYHQLGSDCILPVFFVFVFYMFKLHVYLFEIHLL